MLLNEEQCFTETCVLPTVFTRLVKFEFDKNRADSLDKKNTLGTAGDMFCVFCVSVCSQRSF